MEAVSIGEHPSAVRIIDQRLGHAGQRRPVLPDRRHEAPFLAHGDLALDPHAAVPGPVQKQGLEPVDRPREACLVGLCRLELVPQIQELPGLRAGETTEELDCGPLLVSSDIDPRLLVVDRNVSGLDLDEIVNGQHGHHTAEVNLGRVLISQHHGRQSQMPAMLSAGLAPASVQQPIQAGYPRQAVGCDQEIDLLTSRSWYGQFSPLRW